MTNLMYRKAVDSDANSLAALRVSMVSESREIQQTTEARLFEKTKGHFLSGLRDHSFSMHIALHSDAIVAMGGICYFLLPPTEECLTGKTAYVGNMFTLQDYRNKGIASNILSLLMKEAEQFGVERVILKPTEKGKPIYEKYGFVDWSDAMVFFL